MIKEQ